MRLSYLHGFIVTANPDGSVPLNSRVLAQRDGSGSGCEELVDRFNSQNDRLGFALQTLVKARDTLLNSAMITPNQQELLVAIEVALGNPSNETATARGAL